MIREERCRLGSRHAEECTLGASRGCTLETLMTSALVWRVFLCMARLVMREGLTLVATSWSRSRCGEEMADGESEESRLPGGK